MKRKGLQTMPRFTRFIGSLALVMLCGAWDNVAAQAEVQTLEAFGGQAFYKMFWGELTYTPLGNGTSRVTYQGDQDVFDASFVGKWLEPSRIHHNAAEYPATGRNYFPNVIGVVYAQVLEVEDGRNLIVDFAYNGRNRERPQAVRDEDGTFFFDNRAAVEAWGRRPGSANVLRAEPGAIYAVLGLPRIQIPPDTSWTLQAADPENPPMLHIMASDNFAVAQNGGSDDLPPGSYGDTFGRCEDDKGGGNGALFHLPGRGEVNIDVQWQLLGPTYRIPSLQYGPKRMSLFVDAHLDSTEHGLKRVVSRNQFVIRDRMRAALGFVREGASFALIDQGVCYTGGLDDGEDIVHYNVYRFEGGWHSREPQSFKSRFKSGVRVEYVGESPERRAVFASMPSLSRGQFENLGLRWLNNRRVHIVSDTFTWYQVVNQYWTGGTSTDGADTTQVVVDDRFIYFGDNGDWQLAYGGAMGEGIGLTGDEVNSFNRIPAPGDVIRQSPRDERGAFTNDANNGIVRKISDTEFDLWGWNILPGDVLEHGGRTFTVKTIARQGLPWREYDPVRYANAHPLFCCHPTRVTLDAAIAEPAEAVVFTVVSSSLSHLLSGETVTGRTHYARKGFDHLMYTDISTNYRFENVDYSGYIRCTGQDYLTRTTAAVSGEVQAIPIRPTSAGEAWAAGKKLRIFDPTTGRSRTVTVAETVGGRNEVKIEATRFDEAYPPESIVTAMFSLNRVAEFINCFAVEEDGSPSFDNASEYVPYPLELRRQITKDSRYRVRIQGGRMFARRSELAMPEIELSGRPMLIRGGNSFGASGIINPLVADGKGFVVHGMVMISLKEGYTADLSRVELQGGLFVSGHGALILDGMMATPTAENPAVWHGVEVTANAVPASPETVRDLALRGSGGECGFRIEGHAYPPGTLKMDLQDWTLRPSPYNPRGFMLMQAKADPAHEAFIRINGAYPQ